MWNSLAERFGALNQRTRYGVILLGALLGALLIAELGDIANARAQARREAAVRLARLSVDIDVENWRDRSASANSALSAWRTRIWSGETPGVVAVEIQSQINATASGVALERVRVSVDPTPVDIGGGQALRFRIEGSSVDGAGFAKLVGALSTFERALILDELTMKYSKVGRAFFDMSGVAPIALAATGGDDDVVLGGDRRGNDGAREAAAPAIGGRRR